MTIDEPDGRPRARVRALKRAKRLDEVAEAHEANAKIDDANVQRMIERSIKDHGA